MLVIKGTPSQQKVDSKSSAGYSIMLPVAFWGPWGSAYPPCTPAGLYGQAAGPFRDLLPLDTEINFTNKRLFKIPFKKSCLPM